MRAGRPGLLALALLLAGCGARDNQPNAGAPDDHARGGASANTGSVTRADFERAGLTWPLTVDSGTTGCDGNAAWFSTGGVRYGLNGFASEDRGYADITPIWAEDQEMKRELAKAGADTGTPPRINIGDMIHEALQHCA